MTSRLAVLGFVVLAGVAPFAMAHDGEHGQHKPQSFTEDSVRTFADGTTFKRHVQQTVSAGSITRQETETNPAGKTATRTVTMSFDKSAHTWSRSVQGTSFDGKSYSNSAQGTGFPGGHHHHGGGEGF